MQLKSCLYFLFLLLFSPRVAGQNGELLKNSIDLIKKNQVKKVSVILENKINGSAINTETDFYDAEGNCFKVYYYCFDSDCNKHHYSTWSVLPKPDARFYERGYVLNDSIEIMEFSQALKFDSIGRLTADIRIYKELKSIRQINSLFHYSKNNTIELFEQYHINNEVDTVKIIKHWQSPEKHLTVTTEKYNGQWRETEKQFSIFDQHANITYSERIENGKTVFHQTDSLFYNENGQKTYLRIYDSENKLFAAFEFKYIYDKNGNLVEELEINQGDKSYKKTTFTKDQVTIVRYYENSLTDSVSFLNPIIKNTKAVFTYQWYAFPDTNSLGTNYTFYNKKVKQVRHGKIITDYDDSNKKIILSKTYFDTNGLIQKREFYNNYSENIYPGIIYNYQYEYY